jgi:hypothetical protein
MSAATVGTPRPQTPPAGLPEPARHVGLLSSTLNGLTFDHITAPPAEGEERVSITSVLDTIFGPVT